MVRSMVALGFSVPIESRKVGDPTKSEHPFGDQVAGLGDMLAQVAQGGVGDTLSVRHEYRDITGLELESLANLGNAIRAPQQFETSFSM